MNKWNGSYGIMLTPFAQDGSVNLEEVERQVDILCNADIAGIVVCGSTSEFLFVTEETNKNLMTVAAKAAAGRKPMIGGATSSGREATIGYLQHMAKYGYAGALIAPPYYYKYPDEDIAQYYEEIAEADTGVGIVAYQIPAFTNSIGEQAFEKLLSLRQVEALKNSSKDIQAIAQEVSRKNLIRPDFTILTGTEDAYLPSLTAGCKGGFTAFGALMPNSMARIHRFYTQSQWEKAAEVQQQLLPVQALCAALPFPLGYKIFSELLGSKNAYYHQSISRATRQQMERVKAGLEQKLEECIHMEACKQ